MTSIRFHKNDCEIRSIEDWLRFAPPKDRDKHWEKGRSAMELARAWFPEEGLPQIPSELYAILSSHPDTIGTVIYEGLPEHKVQLDSFRGETRNTDLVLLGHTDKTTIVISIEAKADDPFDQVVAERLSKVQGTRSNIPKRIDFLCQSLFGETVTEFPPLAELRYQLLTGVAGALIEAKNRNAEIALFVVHEFLAKKVREDKVKENWRDFVKFTQYLPGCSKVEIREEHLIGPIQVPGGEFVPTDIPLYIGKVSRKIL
jgi:hypothetical protein